MALNKKAKIWVSFLNICSPSVKLLLVSWLSPLCTWNSKFFLPVQEKKKFKWLPTQVSSKSSYDCIITVMSFSFFSNGTSMISLIIPPKDQISRVAKMLADEFGTASNIKSRVNRLSVLGAITSVQQRLKLYNKGKSNALSINVITCHL